MDDVYVAFSSFHRSLSLALFLSLVFILTAIKSTLLLCNVYNAWMHRAYMVYVNIYYIVYVYV